MRARRIRSRWKRSQMLLNYRRWRRNVVRTVASSSQICDEAASWISSAFDAKNVDAKELKDSGIFIRLDL
eukprot:9482883-Pyramimonas_sp.AAC.1